MLRPVIRLAVLDIAGTTVRDDDLVLECFVSAALATGLRATREEMNARMGQGKLEVFEELAGRQTRTADDRTALRDAAYAKFQATLEEAYRSRGVTPMRGAHETMAWLRSNGVRVALNTGFYRSVTEIIVEKAGFARLVDVVVCVDDVPTGRPAPYMIFEAMKRCGTASVAHVLVAGDTPVDALAGRNAGARLVVGVTSGAHDARTLRAAHATHVLAGVWDLPDLVRRDDRLAPR